MASLSKTSVCAAAIFPDAAAALRLSDALAARFEAAAVSAFEAHGRWNVEVHFPDAPDEHSVRSVIAAIAGEDAAAAATFHAIAQHDWVAASLAQLTPVAAGRFLVHGAHDRDHARDRLVAIEIEAALAFGTGHHGTTRGCLLAFDALLKRHRPRRVLDIGTGTGVLAIAAAKALRDRVLASDIDIQAVTVARANARLNHVPALIDVVHARDLAGRSFRERAPFDLIFANILVGPLKLLARPITRVAAPHAHIVLSGLLPAQANAALAAYRAQHLALKRRLTLDGWTTLVLRRGMRMADIQPADIAARARRP